MSDTQEYLLYLSWSGGDWKGRTQEIQTWEIQTQQYLAVFSSNPWRSKDQNAWIPLCERGRMDMLQTAPADVVVSVLSPG